MTGKFFYWANTGGWALYWSSNPYPNQYGDWKSTRAVLTEPEFEEHKPVFNELVGLNYVEKAELLKKQALKNITHHPAKMAFNWVLNLGRMWYNFPYSHKYQAPRAMLYMVPNSFLFITLLLCSYPLIKFRRHLPAQIIYLVGFSLVFLFELSLLSASSRLMYPIMPLLFIIIAYTLTNLIKLEAGTARAETQR